MSKNTTGSKNDVTTKKDIILKLRMISHKQTQVTLCFKWNKSGVKSKVVTVTVNKKDIF